MSVGRATGLPHLAAEITRLHELAVASFRTSLDHALKAGELLTEAKAQLRHGEWLPWLAEHVDCSERTAQAYMQLAANPQAAAHLTIEDALHAIARPASRPRTARAELGSAAGRDRFPSSAMEWTAWRRIHGTLARVTRAMDETSADGISKWSRREALHEAARHARNVASQLTELADTLAP
jgi:hypothetical protein